MEIARARYLVSDAGRSALAAHAAVDATDPVRLQNALRRSLPAAEASAIAEQLALRAVAFRRFGEVPEMLLTPPGLEMRTPPLVAERRARRLGGFESAADLTCGLGGDLRFITAGTHTVGLERDAPTALLAAANVTRASVFCGDAQRTPLNLSQFAVFLDPSRRKSRQRRFNPDDFSPPWRACVDISVQARAAAIKTSPGLPRDAVPESCEVEWIQVGRSLREATVWMGGDALPGRRRAVLLPGDHILESNAPAAGEIGPVGEYIIDPESCVTRAGLVQHLAARMGAWLLDPQVAYLGAREGVADPLAATFSVIDRVEFSIGRLRKLLRSRRWRPEEIRKRAFPVEPDDLRGLLGRLEGEPVTLLCTTLGGRRWVFVCKRADR